MLQESPEKFIYNSTIGIHAVSAQGIIVYANQFELENLGYKHDEYVGHHVNEFQIDKDCLANMMAKLERFGTLKNYPAKAQSKDSVIYILYNSSVYQDGNEFIHTRCYGTQIENYAYEIFKKNLNR
jgi:PAS domain S-box-containing protein